MASGFVLTLDGCPYVFATSGVASLSGVTSASAEWAAATGAASLVHGALRHPGGWSERVSPVTGELEVDGMTFRVADRVAAAGPATGYPVMSWLVSRSPAQIAVAELSASYSAAATSAISVGSTTGFPSSGTLWIEREAITYTSVTATTFAGTIGRAALNTRARAHALDVGQGYRPAVHSAFPWSTRRRVSLWWIRPSGAAARIWLGYCENAPRLSGGEPAWYEIQAEHTWTVQREAALGAAQATCRLRGYASRGAFTFGVQVDGIEVTAASLRDGGTVAVHDTLDAALAELNVRMRAAIAALAPTKGLTAMCSRHGNAVAFSATASAASSLTVYFGAASESTNSTTSVAATQTSGTRVCSGVHEDIPPVVVLTRAGATDLPIPVDSVEGFPASWTSYQDFTDAPDRVSAARILWGAYDDEYDLAVRDIASAADGLVAGTVSLVPRNPVTTPRWALGYRFVRRAQLRAINEIVATHWLPALRRALVDNVTVVDADIDPRDWDWSQVGEVAAATRGPLSEVTWRLDGDVNLGDLLADRCKLHGVGIGLRAAQVSLFKFAAPTATVAPVATYTSASYVRKQRPGWSQAPECLVNSVRVEGDTLKVVVNDARGRARYGASRTETVRLFGDTGAARAAATPSAVMSYVLAELLPLWREPVRRVSLPVNLDALTEVYLGDHVRWSDWVTPSGAGRRGASSRDAQVVGRDVVLDEGGDGLVRLHALDYDRTGLAGVAPCARVEEIDGNVIYLAREYVYASGGTTLTDYAGSNLPGYEFEDDWADDGGAKWFAPRFTTVGNFRVELVERDNASPHAPEVLEIDGGDINTSDGHDIASLTTPSGDWQTIIDGGGVVDVRFAPYDASGLHAEQKLWAYVGDLTTRVIAGTADAAKRWG